MTAHRFLLEVLCEEIPANALGPAREQLDARLAEALEEAGVEGATVRTISTVRRFVVHVEGLPERLPDRVETVTGPPVRAAYAPDGSPTQAALGFARGQGVEIGDLCIVEGPKGQVVGVTKKIEGRTSMEVLAEVVPTVIRSLHFPKTMRWGSGEHTFVRPVHGVVALFGAAALDSVVSFDLFGVSSGSATVGHRVISPGVIDLLGIGGLSEYLEVLERAGVIVDQEVRSARLVGKTAALADEVGCAVRPDPALVNEHVELVEHPGVVRGAIAANFLELPEEVIVTTLRHHQKCLVMEQGGRVAPHFLAVSDRADDPDGHVVRGNEWVAGARLADAEFFFRQDRKKQLAEHAVGLARVMFHQKLGSYEEKTRSVTELARRVADLSGHTEAAAAAVRAAGLLKADLVTAMVGEFPELQGVIGGIYARLDGEDEKVWSAICDQYQPAGLDGAVPRGIVGAVVGLADRLDTLAAMFSAGEIPSGSKDPFALRRAALGVVKICAEAPLDRLAVPDAAEAAADVRARGQGEVLRGLLDFLHEREHHYLTAVVGVTADVADAVLGARWGVVPEDVARAKALHEVRSESVFSDLAVAFKRVRNMVAKGEPGPSAPTLLIEPAERELAGALAAAHGSVEAAITTGAYTAALRALAGMAAPLDRFFTDVLVLCDDIKLRQARLALLRDVEALFLKIADLSCLATQGS